MSSTTSLLPFSSPSLLLLLLFFLLISDAATKQRVLLGVSAVNVTATGAAATEKNNNDPGVKKPNLLWIVTGKQKSRLVQGSKSCCKKSFQPSPQQLTFLRLHLPLHRPTKMGLSQNRPKRTRAIQREDENQYTRHRSISQNGRPFRTGLVSLMRAVHGSVAWDVLLALTDS